MEVDFRQENIRSVGKWLNHLCLESCLVLTQHKDSEFNYLHINLFNKNFLMPDIGITKVNKAVSVLKELTV